MLHHLADFLGHQLKAAHLENNEISKVHAVGKVVSRKGTFVNDVKRFFDLLTLQPPVSC